MFDSNLLKSINACPYTGFEKVYKSFYKPPSNVYIYESNLKRTVRVLFKDLKTGEFVAGLLLNRLHGSNIYDIQGVYTLSEYRCKGYAKSLLAVAKICFKDVRHSPHLTELGQKFAGV